MVVSWHFCKSIFDAIYLWLVWADEESSNQVVGTLIKGHQIDKLQELEFNGIYQISIKKKDTIRLLSKNLSDKVGQSIEFLVLRRNKLCAIWKEFRSNIYTLYEECKY